MVTKIQETEIEIAGVSITVEKKQIKNLYLKVVPPDGKVMISAPVRMKEEVIRAFAFSKITWIKKQQEKYLQPQKMVEYQYIAGETVYLWGQPYQLEVTESNLGNRVLLSGDKIILQVRKESTLQQREKCLNEWYREQLKKEIPLLISKWESILKVDVKEWGVKNMKTRWGTCNVNARRIWLNLQLAKKSPKCLEYVMVHEMVHLLEASHSQRFYGFMDKFLPNWRETKAELNGRKKRN